MTQSTATFEGGHALQAVDRVVHRVERFTAVFSGLAIFGLMLLGVAQIVGRKFFNLPIYGYIDIIELMMAFVAFSALAYTERLGGHMRMDLIVTRMSGRLVWFFELVTVLLGLFIVSALCFYSWRHAMRAFYSGDTSMDAQLLMWPSKMVVPAAMALLIVRFLVSLWGYVRLLIDPEKTPFGVARMIDVKEQALIDAEAAGVEIDPDAHQGGKN